MFVASAAAVLFAAGAFEVERIRFSGLHRVSYDEALAAAGIRVGDFMGTLDAGRAEHSLEALAWIAEARVTRRWPATVDVDVVERSGAAIALAAPGSWVLVDREGRVLTAPLEAPPDLPRLSGIAAAPQPGAYLGDDADAPLAALNAARGRREFSVMALWRDQRGDLLARVRQTSSGLVIEAALGDDSAVGAKVAAIAAVIEEMSDADAVVSGVAVSDVVIDVSVPHLPVLRTLS